jgi:outer membrane protein assembly factor BamB
MFKSPSTLAFLLAVAPAPTVRAEDWPEFRGPTGQGISTTKGLPVEWSETKNVAWKQPIPGQGWSSPVLSKGLLYLTTAVPADGGLSLRVLALGSKSGETRWNVEAFHPSSGGQQHKKNSPASATPIVEGARLYVHYGHQGTACLDLTGKILWRNTELIYAPVHGNGGSPALVDDLLVFSCDGERDPFIVALDKASGKVRWKVNRDTDATKKFSFSTPLVIEVNGRKQLISQASGAVIAYDPKDGRELWRVRYGLGYSLVPRPVFGHGLIFTATGFDRPTVIAIRPDGSGDVTDTHVVWTLPKGAPNTPSLLLVGDELYVVADSGMATCLDAKTGTVHWHERLGGGFSASPVYAEGKIYFQNEEGVGYVVKASREFQQLAANPLGERSLASYAIGEGALFIRTASHLFRVQQ